jgi:hypothetical protein
MAHNVVEGRGLREGGLPEGVGRERAVAGPWLEGDREQEIQ